MKRFLIFLAAVLTAALLTGSICAAGTVPGDVDGDGNLTSADAVYLLRGILLPEAYSLDGSFDYDKDGALTSADAIYLLRHVLLPDRYPLPETDDPEKEQESEKLQSVLDNAGPILLSAGFSGDVTTDWLENQLSSVLGLNGCGIEINEEDFSVLKTGYEALIWDKYDTTAVVSVRVTGPHGGSAVQKLTVTVIAQFMNAIRSALSEGLRDDPVWDGKIRDDAELSLEMYGDFPSVEDLSELFVSSLDLSKITGSLELVLSIDNNEYYESILEQYNEADFGEEVYEELDVSLSAKSAIYPIETEYNDSFVLCLSVTKLQVDGFVENGGKTEYHVFGKAQTGWKYIDGEYYFFDADGALVPDAAVPDNLHANFDAESDGVTFVQNGEPHFAIISSAANNQLNTKAAEKMLAAALEEIVSGQLPACNNGDYNPGSPEDFNIPVLYLGYEAVDEIYNEYDPVLTMNDYVIHRKGNVFYLTGWSEYTVSRAVDAFVELIGEYADGDSLVIPEEKLEQRFTICDDAAAEGFEPRGNAYEDFVLTYYYGPDPFDCTETIIEKIAEVGFTRMQLYGRFPADKTRDECTARVHWVCETAAKYGMDVCFQDMEDIRPYYKSSAKVMPQEEVDAAVQAVLDRYGDIENISEWMIRDEPKPEEMEKMNRLSDAFHRLDPKHRPVLINLLPASTYRTDPAESYQAYTSNPNEYYPASILVGGSDAISFDKYRFTGDPPVLSEWVYYDNLLSMARTGYRLGVPYGMICLLVQHAGTSDLGKEQLQWEANICLSYGADFVSYFTCSQPSKANEIGVYEEAIFDLNFNTTHHFDDLKSFSGEIKALGREIQGKTLLNVMMHGDLSITNNSDFGYEYGALCEVHGYVPYGDLGEFSGDDAFISFFDDGSFFICNREYSTGKTNIFRMCDTQELEYFDTETESWKSVTECERITGEKGNYTLTLGGGEAILLRAAA